VRGQRGVAAGEDPLGERVAGGGGPVRTARVLDGPGSLRAGPVDVGVGSGFGMEGDGHDRGTPRVGVGESPRSHAGGRRSRDFAQGGGRGGVRRPPGRCPQGRAPPYPALVDEHYYTPSPATDDRRFPLWVHLAGRDLDLVSSASVFSGRGLDKATAVLLDRLDDVTASPPGARV